MQGGEVAAFYRKCKRTGITDFFGGGRSRLECLSIGLG